MSRKELPRAGLVRAALAGRITNRQAATALHLTVRQVQCLKRRFEVVEPKLDWVEERYRRNQLWLMRHREEPLEGGRALGAERQILAVPVISGLSMRPALSISVVTLKTFRRRGLRHPARRRAGARSLVDVVQADQVDRYLVLVTNDRKRLEAGRGRWDWGAVM